MNDNQKWPAVLATAIASIALVAASLVAASAYRSRNDQKLVTVTGSSQQTITSDVVSWGGTFSRTVDPEGLKQGSSQLKADAQEVMTFLAQHNIPADSVDMQPVSVNTNYSNQTDKNGNNTQVFTGYTLSQSFAVESHDLAAVSGAVGSSGDLLDKGLLFQGNQPQYFYSKLADLKIQMINDATKDALARAKAVTQNAGNSVGSLDSASIGVIQITPVNSTDLSGEGTYDTSSVKKEVTVVVHASFSVK